MARRVNRSDYTGIYSAAAGHSDVARWRGWAETAGRKKRLYGQYPSRLLRQLSTHFRRKGPQS